MAGLNKVMIIGNVGTDPEMRYLPNGTAVTKFRIATNRSYMGSDGERKQETDWFSVVTWNKLAEQCNQYLNKGRKVYVEGRLRNHSWDGQDGVKRYMTEVVANTVLFLDRQAASALPEEAAAGEEMTADEIPF